MSEKKKGRIKLIVQIAVVLIMIAILYFMFKDSYKDILAQLSHTNIYIFLGLVFLGNMYYVVDAFIYIILFKKEGYRISFVRCASVAYMSIFFNVTTFGAGIKPAQVLYLHRKGIDAGKGFGIVTMPYIFHKTIIVVYAVVMLVINNSFFMKHFSNTFVYIYIGVALSIGIIIFLILMCTAGWFHRLVFKLVDVTLGRTRFADFAEKLKFQIDKLREATRKIIHDPAAWLLLGAINVLKMSCWYVIPTIAIYAAGGSLGGVTISEALTITALMQLIMGVIPTSGGVGSLEVVFSLVFAAVFGKVMAGSCMILYRLSTYCIPFLVSMVIMAIVGRDARKNGVQGMQKLETDE